MSDDKTHSLPPAEENKDKDAKKKSHRTKGLWLFDAFLYPFLTNFMVFGISVAATYLTSHGAKYGKFGATIQARGDWLMKKFTNWGMTESQADMSKMVFFSFADGTLVAPLVKLFEDRREKIARHIDRALGTEPKDLSVYEAEPKQSWWSVILGRLATVSIVVPTAVFLEKQKVYDSKRKMEVNLNNRLFRNPGEDVGNWIDKQPRLRKWFGKLHVPDLFRIGFFEAFYTTVCTGGLYVSSRFLAGLGKKEKTGATGEVESAEAAPLPEHASPEGRKHRDQLLASADMSRAAPGLG